MPEVRFTIRWPGGEEESCYSPSTVIRQHLQAGSTYALTDFVERARTGLHDASDRVAAKFGFACSSALDQLAKIETTAAEQPADGQVTCLSMS